MHAGLQSTGEAARRLGVSDRRVRALVQSGDLEAVRVGRDILVLTASLERRLEHGSVPGRPLSARMSWAALSTDLCSFDVEWVVATLMLSSTERRRLAGLADRPTAEWVWLTRHRAAVHRFTAPPATLTAVMHSKGVVLSGHSGLEFYASDLSVGGVAEEVYAPAGLVATLAQGGSCQADAGGNLIVHEIPDRIVESGLLARRSVTTMATTAVDLLEDGDPRARRVGLTLLRRIRSVSSR